MSSTTIPGNMTFTPIRKVQPLHVYMSGKLVAIINRQHPGADTYRTQTPWLLLLTDGRVLRFGSYAEAKDEALKRWAPCQFSRK